MAQAQRVCLQWDITGAIILVTSDAVWNAVPGNITNLAAVLARGDAPQYRARPDLDPPAASDPAATAVELVNWKLENDGCAFCIYTGPKHVNWKLENDGYAFCIYTGPKHAFISVVGQCGTGKHDSFKSVGLSTMRGQ